MEMGTSTIDKRLFKYFYAVLAEGLASRHASVKWTIVRNSSSIFGLGLPGVSYLVPYYLDALQRIFTAKSCPVDVKINSVQLLTSLICQSSEYKPAEPQVRTGGDFRDKVRNRTGVWVVPSTERSEKKTKYMHMREKESKEILSSN